MKTYTLCGGKGCCPLIEVGAEETTIGEPGNVCVLKKCEWETLKEKIRSREID